LAGKDAGAPGHSAKHVQSPDLESGLGILSDFGIRHSDFTAMTLLNPTKCPLLARSTRAPHPGSASVFLARRRPGDYPEKHLWAEARARPYSHPGGAARQPTALAAQSALRPPGPFPSG